MIAKFEFILRLFEKMFAIKSNYIMILSGIVKIAKQRRDV